VDHFQQRANMGRELADLFDALPADLVDAARDYARGACAAHA
jgi:hypothetical protein